MSSPRLSIGGESLRGPPVIAGDAKAVATETFKQLCVQFRISELVGTWLVNEGLQTLEDFSGFLTEESQVEERITSKVDGLTQQGLNVVEKLILILMQFYPQAI